VESTDLRQTVQQLSDDLSWLESHCRDSPALADQAGQIRLASSIIRNVVGPSLEGQAPEPLHIVVVGGAGAGKSTVVNFLTGCNAAEANPQAGFTRHPVAFVPADAVVTWAAYPGFLGTLQRRTEDAPSSQDEDIWQLRRMATEGKANPLGDVVVWDCPDMTTWVAGQYVYRLIEASGLADLIVYVASDERYNDEVPTQFLHMLVRTGKPVMVCLTKMRESQADPLVEHFRREVLGRLPRGPSGLPVVPVLAIPFLKSEALDEPAGTAAAKYRVPLLNQAVVLLDNPADSRKRTVKVGMRWLSTSTDGILAAARADLQSLDDWRGMVQAGQVDFDRRYKREYLTGEKLSKLDRAREELIDTIDLPGAGKILSTVLWVLRAPYRLIRGLMSSILVRPDGVNLAEKEVLDSALRGWLDQLRAESLRRNDRHPFWKHISNGFSSGFGTRANEKFEVDYRRFQLGAADAIDTDSRSLTTLLRTSPILLAAVRTVKLMLDLVAIGVGIWLAGVTWWALLAIPILVSLVHQGFELIVWQLIESKRETVRSRKQTLISQTISGPLSEYLIAWPSSGGSAYERLQATLRRVPEGIARLAGFIQQREEAAAAMPSSAVTTAPAPGAMSIIRG